MMAAAAPADPHDLAPEGLSAPLSEAYRLSLGSLSASDRELFGMAALRFRPGFGCGPAPARAVVVRPDKSVAVVDLALPLEPNLTISLCCGGEGGRPRPGVTAVVVPARTSESAFARLVEACPSDVQDELRRRGPGDLLAVRLTAKPGPPAGADEMKQVVQTFFLADARCLNSGAPADPNIERVLERLEPNRHGLKIREKNNEDDDWVVPRGPVLLVLATAEADRNPDLALLADGGRGAEYIVPLPLPENVVAHLLNALPIVVT